MSDDPQALAESVRQACLKAAFQAFEDGGISGLCMEGRWELAMQSIRCLDLQPLLEPSDAPRDNSPAQESPTP